MTYVYQPYPRSLYRKADAGFPFEGRHYAILTVESEEAEAAARADGWHGSPDEALMHDPTGTPSISEEKLAHLAKFDHDGKPGGRKPKRKARK